MPRVPLEEIARRLTLKIPPPKVKPAKPQASWRTLKVGQRLLSRCSYFSPALGSQPPGTIWEITFVSSAGMLLIPLAKHTESDTLKVKGQLRWTDPDWKGSFEKAPRMRKKTRP